LIPIPAELTKYEHEGQKYPSDTYGTFRTKVFVDDTTKTYGLKIPYFSSANKVWVNGKLLFALGVISDNKEDFVPKYLPGEVYFTSDTEEVEIIIQIANFHHRRIKLKNVLFGEAQEIKSLTQRNLIKESTLAGGLLLISVYYAVLYFIQSREKASIWVAALSFVVALRGSILTENCIHLFLIFQVSS
jgi:hypothetical protein